MNWKESVSRCPLGLVYSLFQFYSSLQSQYLVSSRCVPVVTVGAEKRDWLIEPSGFGLNKYVHRDLFVIIFG